MKYFFALVLILTLPTTATLAQKGWQKMVNTGPYVGTSMYLNDTMIIVATRNSGILRFRDSTISWLSSNVGLPPNLQIIRIGYFDSTLFLGSNSGLFVSQDLGAHWSRKGLSYNTTGSVYAFLEHSGAWLVGSDSGLFRSTNNGNSWVRVFADTPRSHSIVQLAQWNSRIYLCDSIGSGNFGILKSSDDGTTWESTDTVGSIDSRMLSFWSGDSVAVVGSNSGMFRSTEGGNPDEHWQPVTDLDGGAGVVYDLLQVGNALVAGTTDGVMISTDSGQSWTPVNEGLPSNIKIIGLKIRRGEIYLLSTDTNWIWFRHLADLPLPAVQIVAADTTACEGSPLTLRLKINFGRAPYTIRWSTNDTSDTIIAIPYADTEYTVTVTDAFGRVRTGSISITMRSERAYILRLSVDTLLALPAGNGYRYQWQRNGRVSVDDTLQTFAMREPGDYTVTVTLPSGKQRTSISHALDPKDSTYTPDLYFPYCIVNYEKRTTLKLMNEDTAKRFISSVEIVPDDPLDCNPDTADFTVVNQLVGVVLDAGHYAQAIVRFAPKTLGLKVAKAIFRSSRVRQGKRQVVDSSVYRLMGVAIADGPYVKAKVVVQPLDSVPLTGSATFTIGIYSTMTPESKIFKDFEENGCISYAIKFFANKTLFSNLIAQGSGNPGPCRGGDPLKQSSNESNLNIDAEIFGGYRGKDTLLHSIDFSPLLGNADSININLQSFTWVLDGRSDTTGERFVDSVTFHLRGICTNGDGPRLVCFDPQYQFHYPKVKLTPNPVDDRLVISYELQDANAVNIAIHDAYGRAVRSIDVGDSVISSGSAALDVSTLPTGCYFVLLRTLGQQAVSRLDITH